MSVRPSVLFIDDEERIVRSLKMQFRGQFDVLATTDPQQALHAVRDGRVHVVVSDQRMPHVTGVELLRQVRELSPNSMRILLTGYSELDAVIASVNEGEIFRFLSKPWDPQELQATVAKAANISASLFAAQDDLHRQLHATTEEVGILVLDEDPAVAELVRDTLGEVGGQHPVHWCDSLDEAFDTLARHPVGLLVSEIRLDDEDISGALKTLKQHHPDILTVILTSFKDTTVLIELINQGQVYRFLPKPVSRALLGRSLAAGINYHRTLRAVPTLAASHAVDPWRNEQEQRLSGRLRTFIDRLRGRHGALTVSDGR